MNKNDYELCVEVGQALAQANLQLAVAESCTGGMLSEWVSAVPGSSAYFLGGVISYSNSVKEGLLAVPESVLDRYGAVSAETAMSMASGVLRLVGADMGISITGVAGPGGGTELKPVGLAYIALACESTQRVEQHIWNGDRQENREQSVRRALRMILEYIRAI